MEGLIALGSLLINIVVASIIAGDANRRNKNGIAWWFISFLLGPIGWIIWFAARPQQLSAVASHNLSLGQQSTDVVVPPRITGVKGRGWLAIMVGLFVFLGSMVAISEVTDTGFLAGIAGIVIGGIVAMITQATLGGGWDTDNEAKCQCRACGTLITWKRKGRWVNPKTDKFDYDLDPDRLERCPQCKVKLKYQ